MRVSYIHRNKSLGYSINRVFETIISQTKNHYNVSEYYMPFGKGTPKSAIKNIIYVRSIRKNKISNIYHITGDVHYLTMALFKSKSVVTVHDIGLMQTLKNPKRFFYSLLRISTLRFASKVVFISDYTKNQVLKHVNLKKDKIHVIPNPIPKEYLYTPKKFNSTYPIVLHVGTGKHKNLLRTIDALKEIKCHLRIIGKLDQIQCKALLDYEIDYSNVIDLTDLEMVDEYKRCDIVNFPSLHEGFGMPIIEGQAIGRVVITSNLAPMNEVSGEGMAFVDPYDEESIRSAYLKIINNGGYRKAIIDNGLINVKRFSADKIVNEYKVLYDSLLSNKV